MTYVDRIAGPLALAVTEAEEPEEESSVIRRAQARDAAAFESLYRAHVSRVHALCLRLSGNASQAEELTQKTFLTAWQKLPLFRAESAFSTWLHRVTANTVFAELRADSRRHRRVFCAEDPAEFETAPPMPATGTRLDLEDAIAALPPQARVVFVLHDVEGWQHHEIAERLGVAVGTSKAQLSRARRILQEALK